MYLDHFELTAKPFQITTDPKFLWLGEKHREALATLRYGIEDNRGFLLLTGEVGTGKTILINRLISYLELDTVVATLPDPDLNSMDFYNLLADGLKMKRDFSSKGAFLLQLRDFLHRSHAAQKQVLLIIDESQRLNHRLMEDIRVLSNIELHDRKLINIFFVGQPEFNNILMTPQNRALMQRITVRYHIEPLDQNETGAYINHRLKVAGSKKPIFKQNAVIEVFRFSGGIPRLINIVCDHAMLTAYGKSLKHIDAGIIEECAEELRIPVENLRSDAAKPGGTDSGANAGGEATAEIGVRPEPVDTTQIRTMDQDGRRAGGREERKSPLIWKLAYFVFIALLIGALAYGISRYAGAPAPRYNVSDLTPQKYRATLEEEKERLTDQLSHGEPQESDRPATDEMSREPLADKRQELQGDVEKSDDTADNPDGRNLWQHKGTDQAPAMPDAAPGPQMAIVGDDDRAGRARIAPLPLMQSRVTIQFDFNSNEIETESYPVLDRIAQYLVAHPDQIIDVRGYTDTSGIAAYNETVSRFRANAVKTYLIGKGAATENIRIFAMGDADPIASNETAAGRKKNRRVEIEFIQG